ncbi:FtsX-like permease family protein [bacterium BMS3Abin07]|nr:FtsX-like permease family protein [bacterium BMS3Abin07]GBE31277.1 FtsX-like permease family protein [bacterium BMS3Bbin05]
MKVSHIALKNIKRKFFRSIAIIISVTVVAATLFSVTTVMDSVETSLEKGTARLGADIMVVPAKAQAQAKATLLAGEPSTFYMDRNIVDRVRKIEGVKAASSQVFLKTAKYKCCAVNDMQLIGFNPSTDFSIKPWLIKKLSRPLRDNEIIMGRELTAFDVGSSIRIYGKDMKVVGMLDETGMKFIDNSVFMPYSAMEKISEESKTKKGVKAANLPIDKISTVLVQVAPEISAERVAIFIEHEIDGVKALVTEHVISSVRKQLFVLLRSVFSISIILWVMALLLIGVVFSMIVNERQREIGLLRSMGASKGNIFRLIMTEASILSLSGGILGIIIGGVFIYVFRGLIRSSLNIPYLWPSPLEFIILIAICLFLSLATGTGAALYPAIRSMRMEPYEAIRGGE